MGKEKKDIKIVFAGTPQFSADILGGLLGNGFNIIGVITESDKPVGRKQELTPSSVKVFAEEKNLEVFQPDSHKEISEILKRLSPDVFIVVAYGRILKKETLICPIHGCLNIHPSLLPKYRGPSPIQTTILDGDEISGVSIIKMDEGIDTGPIVSREEMNIDKNETSSSLFKKVANLAVDLLDRILVGYVNGDIEPISQSKEGISYTKMIQKRNGKVDFDQDAKDEERKARAYDIWPGVHANWGNKRVKFLEIEYSDGAQDGKKPGEIYADDEGGLLVAFEKGAWIVNKLQLEGKNVMDTKSFLNGHKNFIGSILE